MPIAAWQSNRRPSVELTMESHLQTSARRTGLPTWWASLRSLRSLVGFALVGTLLVLGVANVALRATWHRVEDGVLWGAQPEGVVVKDIAEGTAAAGKLRPGDILEEIDGKPVDTLDDVQRVLDKAPKGAALRYKLVRLGSTRLVDITLTPMPVGNVPLYFILAAVGIFSLLVAISVRLRRPRDPATLHFFLLSVGFFGVFTFSPSGRLDALDWIFYWANEVSILLLPPLFLHFTLAFPERARREGALGGRIQPFLYLPAVALGITDVVVFARAPQDPRYYITQWAARIDRLEYLYLAICLVAGFLVWVWALSRVRTVTGRRQLRWIVSGVLFGGGPFVFGYALPWSLGGNPGLAMQLLAIPLGLLPLAFASAVVRYRLMDVEVIIKRTLIYAAAVLAIGGIYAALLKLVGAAIEDPRQHYTIIAMLATLVVVLLARPVKNAIQNTFDRAFYRDRYDYRRALVGFARDLNSDLDLNRLSERLVARIMETFVVDRIALMLADADSQAFVAIRSAGLEAPAPRLPRANTLGARLASGQPVALDEPATARALKPEDVERWREREIYYFVPCVSKGGCNAVLALGRRSDGEPLNSEDLSLLIAVAGHVATALENGRLYRQLRGQAEEVDRMREFSESIIESLEAGLLVADANWRVVRWNRALERLYGVSRANAVGRPLAELFDAGFLKQLEAARSDTPNIAGVHRLSLHTRDDGRLLVNVTVVPLRSYEGTASSIVGTIIIIDDVTSRVHLEEQLQISEKMASIGILAAGVAHEVNTPLTGISSFTQMLLEGSDPMDPKTKVLEKIERQTFRAAKIVNGLLNLARPGSPTGERVQVDVNAVINDVLSLFEHQFRVAKIQVRRDLASSAPMIMGSEFKLQQVFLNLFLNARDAMPKGGWLSISTRVNGDVVAAEVADTGTGIPREHLSRIYDPFFTTKAIGQGTGLGLSITYGIVREHDGSIACDSTTGEGTRFTLSFPLAAAAVERPSRVMS
jgi:hypothetical protein